MNKLNIVFVPTAWEDYLYWHSYNLKLLKRINQLINECQRNPFEGVGKPEQLRFGLKGSWSRRIDSQHRLVYKVIDEDLIIIQCRYHYNKK